MQNFAQSSLFDDLSEHNQNDLNYQNETKSELVPEFSVSETTALFNQIFETATPTIRVIGEIANFKINQNKWIFFDIKDEESSLGCFASVFQISPNNLENGMKVALVANPKITKWGKFSLTVQNIQPIGEGAIKRAFELLRTKLDREGIFAPERKRILPDLPQKIGVISSVDAAGYKDFIKIIGERMSGMEIIVAPVQVQGEVAARQICNALQYFNEESNVEIIAILRGGGSRDDLVAFDDENLVRAIASSRAPILTGIGHEIDTTLADLAADFRASTPSNAAEILVPDKREILSSVDFRLNNLLNEVELNLANASEILEQDLHEILMQTEKALSRDMQKFNLLNANLLNLNPREILHRGYAILRSESGEILRTKPQINDKITIENAKYLIESEVKNVREK